MDQEMAGRKSVLPVPDKYRDQAREQRPKASQEESFFENVGGYGGCHAQNPTKESSSIAPVNFDSMLKPTSEPVRIHHPRRVWSFAYQKVRAARVQKKM